MLRDIVGICWCVVCSSQRVWQINGAGDLQEGQRVARLGLIASALTLPPEGSQYSRDWVCIWYAITTTFKAMFCCIGHCGGHCVNYIHATVNNNNILYL